MPSRCSFSTLLDWIFSFCSSMLWFSKLPRSFHWEPYHHPPSWIEQLGTSILRSDWLIEYTSLWKNRATQYTVFCNPLTFSTDQSDQNIPDLAIVFSASWSSQFTFDSVRWRHLLGKCDISGFATTLKCHKMTIMLAHCESGHVVIKKIVLKIIVKTYKFVFNQL